MAACQNERSQHKNKERAMSMLRSKLYEFELEKKREATRKIEDSKLDIDFGSQIRSYILQPYRLIKDHRTKTEVGDVDRVIDGDLQPFIRAYLRMRRGGGGGGGGWGGGGGGGGGPGGVGGFGGGRGGFGWAWVVFCVVVLGGCVVWWVFTWEWWCWVDWLVFGLFGCGCRLGGLEGWGLWGV